MSGTGSWWWLVHPEERRLRAAWRLLVWVLAVGGLGVPAGALVWASGIRSLPFALAVQGLVVVPPTLLLARFVDRRPLAGIGLGAPRRLGLHLVLGALIGMGLIAGIALTEHAAGLARYAPVTPDYVALAISLGVFALVALDEELVFRGYLLTNLAEAWGGERRVRGVVGAMIVSSAVFGAAHLANPGAGLVPILNIALAGFLLALPYVLTGELGLSLGLHFGWNLAQAWLGMAVSGNELPGALASRALTSGHEAWTGGEFGAEGGLLGLVALAVGALVLGPLAWRLRDDDVAEALGAAPSIERPVKLVPTTEPALHPAQPIELGPAHPEDVLEHGHDARAQPGVRADGPAVKDEPFGE